jgi:hypothetical protein
LLCGECIEGGIEAIMTQPTAPINNPNFHFANKISSEFSYAVLKQTHFDKREPML